jgi:hypothetical protein
MAGKSITLQTIDFVSKGPCADLLVPRGFRRKSTHFFRQVDGLYHCIHFQASPWGTSGDGKFTFNIYVTSPELISAFVGPPFPKNPATASWPINKRIGQFLPKPPDSPNRCDYWWEVNLATNFEIIGHEIAANIEKYVLPFFDRYPNADSLLTRALTETSDREWDIFPSQRPMVAAILYARRGDKVQAFQILKKLFDKSARHPFQETVGLVAERLNMDLR